MTQKAVTKGLNQVPKDWGTEKINTQRKGKDKNKWVVKSFNGVKRWVKLKEGKVYYTLDNGLRPYKVVDAKNKVLVYKKNRDDYSFLKEFLYKKIFIGSGKKNSQKGNSILVLLNNGKYLFIGHTIYTFKTKDTIEKYFSIVGNSEVPYPIALGKENVYFMLDKVYAPRNILGKVDWYDAYSHFYGFRDPKIEKKFIRKF